MINYQLDYVVEEVLKGLPSQEQIFLKKHIGKDFPKTEAKYLWERIGNHKWYVSERLGRDIGLRVAAVDYIENFYEPTSFFDNEGSQSNGFRKVLRSLNAGLRNYFVEKSKIMT